MASIASVWRSPESIEKRRKYGREYQRKRRAENPELVCQIGREHARKQREKNPDFVRNQNLKKNFGITAAEYDRMFASQGGACAICKLPERAKFRGTIKALAVDHDHATGVIRGLLCTMCNTGLGNLLDGRLFSAALDYLNKSSAEVK